MTQNDLQHNDPLYPTCACSLQRHVKVLGPGNKTAATPGLMFMMQATVRSLQSRWSSPALAA